MDPANLRVRSFHHVRHLWLPAGVELRGPGVLAFDGDRERKLAAGQAARLRVVRDGPPVVDVERALELAARRGLFRDRGEWRDAYDQFLRGPL